MMTQKAWIIPGIQKRRVSKQLIAKSFPQPFSASTPNGGKKKAKMNLKMSEHVSGISELREKNG